MPRLSHHRQGRGKLGLGGHATTLAGPYDSLPDPPYPVDHIPALRIAMASRLPEERQYPVDVVMGPAAVGGQPPAADGAERIILPSDHARVDLWVRRRGLVEGRVAYGEERGPPPGGLTAGSRRAARPCEGSVTAEAEVDGARTIKLRSATSSQRGEPPKGHRLAGSRATHVGNPSFVASGYCRQRA